MKSLRIVLGFDFGYKRIGMAVGQTITHSANPLPVLLANDGIPDWKKLADIIKQWRPDALIVGIPLKIDSSEQFTTHAAREFAAELSTRFQLPVFSVDERYTTIEARQVLFEQGGYKKLKQSHIDSWAAKIIVEDWLQKTASDTN